MIEVNHISFKYAGSKRLVFDDFSLRLEENRIYGLLGKNGTGKSTLLYLISGLLRPQSGSVSCDGVATKDRQPETLRDIFLVTEEFEMWSISEVSSRLSKFHLNLISLVLRLYLWMSPGETYRLRNSDSLGDSGLGLLAGWLFRTLR